MNLKINLVVLAVLSCSLLAAQQTNLSKIQQLPKETWQFNPRVVSEKATVDKNAIEGVFQFSQSAAPMQIENTDLIYSTSTTPIQMRAPMAKDSTLYVRPRGVFFAGLAQSYMSPTTAYNILFVPAESPVKWINLSSYPSNVYSWILPDPDGTTSGASIQSTDDRPIQTFRFGVYDVLPTLTSTVSGKLEEYKWGDKTLPDRLLSGASVAHQMIQLGAPQEQEIGACNYDAQKGYDDFSFQSVSPTGPISGYLYGTRTDNMVKAVANFFEKPVHAYTIDKVWIHASECIAPANTEFTLIIHRITYDENSKIQFADTLATSTITIEDVKGPLHDGRHYTLLFDKLMSYNEEYGLDMEVPFIEVEDEILIELKGFDEEGVTLGVFGQIPGTAPGKEQNAAVFVEDSIRGRVLTSYSYYPTSLMFNLDATYSFLFADSDVFNAPPAGGEKTFEISSLYVEESVKEIVSDLPYWLNTFKRPDADGRILYTITASELPANIPYREHTIWLVTKGAEFAITITQGTSSAVDDITIQQVNVVSAADEFQLTYSTAVFRKVSVWNTTGVLVAEYALPQEGKFVIPTTCLPQGIYILTLTGNRSKSVKIIK